MKEEDDSMGPVSSYLLENMFAAAAQQPMSREQCVKFLCADRGQLKFLQEMFKLKSPPKGKTLKIAQAIICKQWLRAGLKISKAEKQLAKMSPTE